MKIYPRVIDIAEGSETCSFKIKNASNDDRVLLFKIRRSEPKLLEFQPKFGIVEPGVTKHVSMQLVNPKVSFARVLVKLVAIKRSKLLEDFQESWQLASTKGVVKKVVDVRNLAFGGDDDDEGEGVFSLASEDIGDLASPVLSPTSQLLDEDGDDDKAPATRRRGHEADTDRETGTEGSGGEGLHRPVPRVFSSTPAKAASASTPVPAAAASSPAPSVLSPSSEQLLELGGAEMSDGADEAGFAARPVAPVARRPATAPAPAPAHEVKRSPLRGKPAYTAASKAAALACSKARAMAGQSNLPPSGAASINITVTGAGDAVAADAIALRAVEKLESRGRIVSIEIHDCPLSSLADSVSTVFSGPGELESMRAVLLEDHLRHLSVTACPSLRLLDSSIRRFALLATLDLSNNGLTHVEGGLELPLLHRLDVSNNCLTNLEFVQDLRALKTLLAGGNGITSIRAVQTLIPLGATLTNINLSRNPICKDLRYASTVINVLPRLRLFDSRDVAALGRTYSRHGTPTRGPTPAGSSRGPPPLPTDASSLDSELLAAAGQDGEDRLAQEEFDRRLKRAVKEKHAKRGAAAGYSEDDGDDEGEGSEASNADWHGHRPRASSSTPPARPSSSSSVSVRPSLASSLRSHLSEQRRMSPPQRSDPRDIAHAHTARMSASLPGPSSSRVGGSFGRASLRSDRDAAALSSSLSAYTQSNKAKRASQRMGHVAHWAGHESDVPADTPRKEEGAGDEMGEAEAEEEPPRNRSVSGITVGSPRRTVSPRKESTLLVETRAHVLRMKAYGIPPSPSNTHRARPASAPSPAARSGYQSDGGLSTASVSARARRSADATTLQQRAENERYSIWHPRYRVPRKTFGYSQPFIERPEPDNPTPIPLFDKYVRRMRDGFEKNPTRGTFSRASKGLMAEWYPMDHSEVEAIRRQGFFHETIGDIQKFSYRDLRTSGGTLHRDQSISVDRTGRTVLAPKSGMRRGVTAMHQSRQYKTLDGRRDTDPADEYSGYRKWNPQEWTKHGNNTNAALYEPGTDVDGLAGTQSPQRVALSREWLADSSFARHEASMSFDASDVRPASLGSAYRSSFQQHQQQHQQQQQYTRPQTDSWSGQAASARVEHEEQQLTNYMAWLEATQGGAIEAPVSAPAPAPASASSVEPPAPPSQPGALALVHPRQLAERPERRQDDSPVAPLQSLMSRTNSRARASFAADK